MILNKKDAIIKLMNNMPGGILKIADALNKNGFDCFVVGGCIRDAFLDITPHDFDLTTNALPQQVMKTLSDADIKCEERGVEFGVVVANVISMEFEISTFRTDISGGTGNLMDDDVILGVTIEEDCFRRDFTINALFFDINKQEIIDLVGGIDDLQNGIIRTVGNPEERFAEDSTRKLRAIRFSSRLGFKMDQQLINSIISDPALHCNNERIMLELNKIFDINKDKIQMNHTFERMIELGLLQEAFKGCILRSNMKGSVISISTMIAKLINPLTDMKILNDIVKDSNILNNIEVLWKLDNENLLEEVSIIDIHRKLKSGNLNPIEAVSFTDNQNTILFFNSTIPTLIKQFNEGALKEGLKGKEIGNFTREKVQELFKQIKM